jgi:peptide/nickel transport system permease protein
MARFVALRMSSMVVVILVLAAVMFVLRNMTPTDPAKEILGPHASAQAMDALRHDLWLDRPLPVQYVHFVANMLQGDVGVSIRTRRPVAQDLRAFVPTTLELAAFGVVLALLEALALALLSTTRWKVAGFVRVIMISGASAPVFMLAVFGILIFFGKLGWLPPSGQTSFFDAPSGPTGFMLIDSLIAGRFDVFTDALQHIVLPAVCISIGPAVAIGRVLRSSLLTSLQSDYILTARAKGLSDLAILFRHALRNSVGPALSMTGLQLGLMFAGVVVIEDIFAWPGIGYYTALSIPAGDYPAIIGVTLVIGVGYVVINAMVDLLQAAADPRIRL